MLTPDAEAREALKHRLRGAVTQGLAPEAFVRVTQFVFGPPSVFPVEFRIMGPDPAQLYAISEKALDIMRGVSDVRQANRDWGNRTPVLRFVPDQDRLNLIGLSPAEVGQQLQFLLTGNPVTQVREDIRNLPSWHVALGPRGWTRRAYRFFSDGPGRPAGSARSDRIFRNPSGRAKTVSLRAVATAAT